MGAEHDDELVTRSSAMVITWLRTHLKNEIRQALKEIYAETWRDVLSYLYRSNWIRLLAGLLTLLSALALFIKEHQ